MFFKTSSYGLCGLFNKDPGLLKDHADFSIGGRLQSMRKSMVSACEEERTSCHFHPSLLSPLLLLWDKESPCEAHRCVSVLWWCWVPGRAGGTTGGTHLKSWVTVGPLSHIGLLKARPLEGLEKRQEVLSQHAQPMVGCVLQGRGRFSTPASAESKKHRMSWSSYLHGWVRTGDPPFCFTSLCPLYRNVFDVFLLEGEKLAAFFSSGLLLKFSLSSTKTVIH